MHTVRVALILLAATAAGNLAAVEGMWVPQQLPDIAGPLARAGLKLDPAQLSDLRGDPMGAVVAINGCTASFVSPEGLVVTNHHCAYGAIQLNSTPDRNLMKEGFVAGERGEELSAGPSARVFVLDDISDVTARIDAVQNDRMDGGSRFRAVEVEQKRLIAECEKTAGTRCTVYSFFGGAQYRLVRNLEIRDVRLVYAPPQSIGNYGGEIDNWTWPRHTGDFSFYRAYVGPDGKPASYAEDNVPYRPRHWLRFASEPLSAGDFVMIAGYPGRTARYALAGEFDDTATWTYPTVGAHYKRLVAMTDAAGRTDADIQVRYASRIRGWQNVMKNYDGQLEGFARIGAAARKSFEEKALLDALRASGEQGAQAVEAHAALERIAADARRTSERDLILSQLAAGGLPGTAVTLYRNAIEHARPDAARKPGYQARDQERIAASMREFDQRFVARMDRDLVAYWLAEYVKLPTPMRVPALDAWLGGSDAASIGKALDQAYARTKLDQVRERERLADAERAAFESSDDSMIELALALMPTLLAIEAEADARAGESLRYRPVFLTAMADQRKAAGRDVYPDANSSLRISFGNVQGYSPRDGVMHTPFTTLAGVAAKATGEEPFAAPTPLLDAIAAGRTGKFEDPDLGTVPVNFLCDLDITGGNSGSPVLDANGRLVGLAFDGNWESVASNWVYDGTLSRTIALDARYLRWIVNEVFPAPALVRELAEAESVAQR